VKQNEVACNEVGSTDLLCECYPNHCEHGDKCWCEPEVYEVNGVKIIVHREVH